MIEYLQRLLEENDFMPHGHCYLWEPIIMWSHAISDSIIAFAYFTIPLTLIYIVRKRKDFTYIWLLILFAIFILGCGTTHIFDVITIWTPLYRLDSIVRVITALASIATAVVLARITPAILVIPNTKEWERVNSELVLSNENLIETNEELSRTDELLREMNMALEARVIERTKELEHKNHELVKINNDLDNFVYTASHDLKAPIANLQGLMAALEESIDEKISEEEKKLIGMVNNTINRFNNTITDLTEITKIQKQLHIELEEVNIAEILEEVIMDLQPQIQDSKAEIEIYLNEKIILLTKKNLRSIIYNLINNSIKYRSNERPLIIRIESFIEEGHTVFTVSDNGLGFDMQKKHKIFSMFRRLHDHVEGSGLGLYIVNRIVENYKGRIDVESEVNKGTTFIIFFNKNKDA